jgi:hypothetical protein
MAKLKEGEKVVQKFEVTIKFRAQAGDEKYKKSDIIVALLEPEMKIIVKEVKEEVPFI